MILHLDCVHLDSCLAPALDVALCGLWENVSFLAKSKVTKNYGNQIMLCSVILRTCQRLFFYVLCWGYFGFLCKMQGKDKDMEEL